MARKPQENPQLDMTPMIDVVFELIIFFVVDRMPDDGSNCILGKPVIYLYPERETEVRVELAIDGRMTASEPEYGGGWSVTACASRTTLP